MKRIFKLFFLGIVALISSNNNLSGQTCATLSLPANGATGIGLTGTLTWTAPSDNSLQYYRVYIGTTTNANEIVNGSQTNSSSYNFSGLTCNTTYYWKIEAIYRRWVILWWEYYAANCSALNSFTTGRRPKRVRK